MGHKDGKNPKLDSVFKRHASSSTAVLAKARSHQVTPNSTCCRSGTEASKKKMSPAPTVLIIGCGVAGPVLGNLLIQKGYHPIVFEKVSELGDAGASLMLMSNG